MKKNPIISQEHIINTLNKYEDGPDIAVSNQERITSNEQLEKLALQPNFGGKLWRSFVAHNEETKDQDNFLKKQLKKQPIVKQVIQNSPKKISEVEMYKILKKSATPEELKKFPDEIEKAKNLAQLKSNKTYSELAGKGASPRQVADLAYRLEKNRQEMGGPFESALIKVKKPINKNELVHDILKIDPVVVVPPPIMRKPEPEFNLEKYITDKSREKLEREQDAFDREYGKFGIVSTKRPV